MVLELPQVLAPPAAGDQPVGRAVHDHRQPHRRLGHDQPGDAAVLHAACGVVALLGSDVVVAFRISRDGSPRGEHPHQVPVPHPPRRRPFAALQLIATDDFVLAVERPEQISGDPGDEIGPQVPRARDHSRSRRVGHWSAPSSDPWPAGFALRAFGFFAGLCNPAATSAS